MEESAEHHRGRKSPERTASGKFVKKGEMGEQEEHGGGQREKNESPERSHAGRRKSPERTASGKFAKKGESDVVDTGAGRREKNESPGRTHAAAGHGGRGRKSPERTASGKFAKKGEGVHH